MPRTIVITGASSGVGLAAAEQLARQGDEVVVVGRNPERMRDDLHYGDPCSLFDHCKRAFSKQVALLHDYGLYEFTIRVRKA